MKGCRTVQEYAKYVAMIRENRKTMETEEAVTKAVDDCIEMGILRDFLIRNKARVILHEVLDAPGEGHKDEHIRI